MTRQRFSVDELQVGMYVAKLDVSWFRSPFLRHAFLIEHRGQIDRLLRAGVKHVEIDLTRSERTPSASADTPAARAPRSSPTSRPMEPAGKSLAQLNEEYAQGVLARQQLARAVQSVFSTIEATGRVDPRQTAEAVQEITIVTRTLSNSAIFLALSQHRAGDSLLSQHALTACTLSLVLGQALQLNPLELHELATAALLHDIGLLHIPASLVRRARTTSSPLTERDRRQFQTHPRLGILMLERQGNFEAPVLHLIGEHHAYLDGSGYPPETRGEFTSARTRVLMIADKYDEFITGFGGASPLAPHQALQRLYHEAQDGTLDRDILSRFIKLIGIYPVHSHVRLNTNELAVVTNLNPSALHRPVVAITHNPEGEGYPLPLIVDLAHQEGQPRERAIDDVLDAASLSHPLHPPCAA